MTNFKYALLRLMRNKANLFWILVFPILLGCLFKIAFSNITASENFHTIPVAVVEGDSADAAAKSSQSADGSTRPAPSSGHCATGNHVCTAAVLRRTWHQWGLRRFLRYRRFPIRRESESHTAFGCLRHLRESCLDNHAGKQSAVRRFHLCPQKRSCGSCRAWFGIGFHYPHSSAALSG